MTDLRYIAVNTRYLDRIRAEQVSERLPRDIHLVYFPEELEHVSSEFLDKYSRRDCMIFKTGIENFPSIMRILDELEYCSGLSQMPSKVTAPATNMVIFEFDTESG